MIVETPLRFAVAYAQQCKLTVESYEDDRTYTRAPIIQQGQSSLSLLAPKWISDRLPRLLHPPSYRFNLEAAKLLVIPAEAGEARLRPPGCSFWKDRVGMGWSVSCECCGPECHSCGTRVSQVIECVG